VVAFHFMAVVVATASLGAGSLPPTTAGNPVVLWLGPFEAGALDGAALLEAVSVYTRDLSLETRTATDVPPPTPAARDAGVDAAAGAALRAHGARLGFWCEPAPDARTTALIIVDGEGRLAVRVVDSAGLDRPELHRAIALKLRAVLAATIGPEAAAISGGAPRAPPSSPAPAVVVPPASAAVRTDSAASGSAGAVVVATAPPFSRGPSRFFAAIGYRVSTPLGSGAIQQGAAAEAGARLGSALELATGAAIETRATGSSGAEGVSLFDLPIELEARWVRRGRHPSRLSSLSWGGGAFAAVHLTWATATAALGARQTSFDLGGGIGVAALVRGALGGGVAGEARLYAELPLPSTTYWVAGVPVLDRGARVGLGLALVFPSL
jgi:hypothetical protein